MDRSAEEILDELHETGARPSDLEIAALCGAVIEGERATAKFEALERALARVGWSIVDTTTDDDDATVLELIPPASQENE